MTQTKLIIKFGVDKGVEKLERWHGYEKLAHHRHV
jgi:hypothetical protein